VEFEFNKNNIIEWARKYDETCTFNDRETEKRIKTLLEEQRYLTQENLRDIMNWKSPRIRRYAYKNDELIIKERTQYSFETENERSRIESLLGHKGGLRGVGYPVASVILHFAFPDKYPIIDFRVIRSLKSRPFNLDQPSVYSFGFWERYCEIIRNISKEYELCIRVIDKALWKFDKEKYSRSNKCLCDD
jgi:thermostable 8-oxoguanine DNA glycosylase